MISLGYEAALADSAWRAFTEDAAVAFGCQLAMVEYQDQENPQRSFIVTGGLSGFEEAFTASRSHSEDDNYLRAIRNQPPGTVRLGSEIVAPDAMHQSEAYSRLAKPWQLEHFLFGAITSGDGIDAFFSLGRTARESPFVAGDKILINDLLLSHLRRGLTLRRETESMRSANRTLSAALDQAPSAVVVFDRRGRPIIVNQAAWALFSIDDGLTMRDGALHATDPATTLELARALQVALHSALGGCVVPASPVLIPRRSTQPAYKALFSPLHPPSSRVGIPSNSAMVAIIHANRGDSLQDAPAGLASTYDLSQAEIRLCQALVHGQTLLEAANTLNISRNTAKTHLARIFEKTGTHSQATLLRLLGHSGQV